MFRKIQSLLKILKKYAADDVPGWMPEWVHSHKAIRRTDSLSKIEKKIPVSDFEIDITPIDTGKQSQVTSILTNCHDDYQDFFNKDIREQKCIDDLLKKLIDADYKDIKLLNFVSESYNDGNFKKTISFQPGTSIIKILQNIKARLIKNYPEQVSNILFDNQIRSLEILNNDKTKGNKIAIKLCFSTKPSDILGMSSRSDWTSCQNLFTGNYKERAIASALNKYTGIMYITSTHDYKGRGEEILVRCLVFYAIDKDGNDVLLIPKIYPTHLSIGKWFNFFKSHLEKHSNLPIFIGTDRGLSDLYIPNDIEEETPYLDTNSIILNMKPKNHSDELDAFKNYLKSTDKDDFAYKYLKNDDEDNSHAYSLFEEALNEGSFWKAYEILRDQPYSDNFKKRVLKLIKDTCKSNYLFIDIDFFKKQGSKLRFIKWLKEFFGEVANTPNYFNLLEYLFTNVNEVNYQNLTSVNKISEEACGLFLKFCESKDKNYSIELASMLSKLYSDSPNSSYLLDTYNLLLIARCLSFFKKNALEYFLNNPDLIEEIGNNNNLLDAFILLCDGKLSYDVFSKKLHSLLNDSSRAIYAIEGYLKKYDFEKVYSELRHQQFSNDDKIKLVKLIKNYCNEDSLFFSKNFFESQANKLDYVKWLKEFFGSVLNTPNYFNLLEYILANSKFSIDNYWSFVAINELSEEQCNLFYKFCKSQDNEQSIKLIISIFESFNNSNEKSAIDNFFYTIVDSCNLNAFKVEAFNYLNNNPTIIREIIGDKELFNAFKDMCNDSSHHNDFFKLLKAKS